MKILLDNCVHVLARELFVGHEVLHARDLGWRDLSNGRLMAEAAAQSFDVLATTDKKIRHEHNLDLLPVAVLELASRFTRLADLRELTPHIERALAATRTHRFVSVSPDGEIQTLALQVKR